MSFLRRVVSRLICDLAIDFGTSNTVIYLKDKGIVLDEPSIVAIEHGSGRFVAYGRDAKAMLGRTPEGIITIRPIQDGVIANAKVAESLLRHFIGKAIGFSGYRCRRIVVGIPSVITAVEKRAVIDSTLRAGGSDVYLVDQSMAAAIGASLPVTEAKGSMVVDVGGGTTDISVISLCGLVHSQTLRLAGSSMDAALTDYVRRKYDLLIGAHTAEQLKILIGGESEPTDERGMPVNGRARLEGLPATVTVSRSDFLLAIEEPLRAIAAGVLATLERVPPELSGDIADQGITLTGGGALIPQIGQRIEQVTRIRTHIAPDPLRTVVMGAGKLLAHRRQFERVLAVWRG